MASSTGSRGKPLFEASSIPSQFFRRGIVCFGLLRLEHPSFDIVPSDIVVGNYLVSAGTSPSSDILISAERFPLATENHITIRAFFFKGEEVGKPPSLYIAAEAQTTEEPIASVNEQRLWPGHEIPLLHESCLRIGELIFKYYDATVSLPPSAAEERIYNRLMQRISADNAANAAAVEELREKYNMLVEIAKKHKSVLSRLIHQSDALASRHGSVAATPSASLLQNTSHDGNDAVNLSTISDPQRHHWRNELLSQLNSSEESQVQEAHGAAEEKHQEQALSEKSREIVSLENEREDQAPTKEKAPKTNEKSKKDKKHKKGLRKGKPAAKTEEEEENAEVGKTAESILAAPSKPKKLTEAQILSAELAKMDARKRKTEEKSAAKHAPDPVAPAKTPQKDSKRSKPKKPAASSSSQEADAHKSEYNQSTPAPGGDTPDDRRDTLRPVPRKTQPGNAPHAAEASESLDELFGPTAAVAKYGKATNPIRSPGSPHELHEYYIYTTPTPSSRSKHSGKRQKTVIASNDDDNTKVTLKKKQIVEAKEIEKKKKKKQQKKQKQKQEEDAVENEAKQEDEPEAAGDSSEDEDASASSSVPHTPMAKSTRSQKPKSAAQVGEKRRQSASAELQATTEQISREVLAKIRTPTQTTNEKMQQARKKTKKITCPRESPISPQEKRIKGKKRRKTSLSSEFREIEEKGKNGMEESRKPKKPRKKEQSEGERPAEETKNEDEAEEKKNESEPEEKKNDEENDSSSNHGSRNINSTRRVNNSRNSVEANTSVDVTSPTRSNINNSTHHTANDQSNVTNVSVSNILSPSVADHTDSASTTHSPTKPNDSHHPFSPTVTSPMMSQTWNQTELNEALVIVILNIKGKSVQTKQSMDVVYKPFFKIADPGKMQGQSDASLLGLNDVYQKAYDGNYTSIEEFETDVITVLRLGEEFYTRNQVHPIAATISKLAGEIRKQLSEELTSMFGENYSTANRKK